MAKQANALFLIVVKKIHLETFGNLLATSISPVMVPFVVVFLTSVKTTTMLLLSPKTTIALVFACLPRVIGFLVWDMATKTMIGSSFPQKHLMQIAQCLSATTFGLYKISMAFALCLLAATGYLSKRMVCSSTLATEIWTIPPRHLAHA